MRARSRSAERRGAVRAKRRAARDASLPPSPRPLVIATTCRRGRPCLRGLLHLLLPSRCGARQRRPSRAGSGPGELVGRRPAKAARGPRLASSHLLPKGSASPPDPPPGDPGPPILCFRGCLPAPRPLRPPEAYDGEARIPRGVRGGGEAPPEAHVYVYAGIRDPHRIFGHMVGESPGDKAGSGRRARGARSGLDRACRPRRASPLRPRRPRPLEGLPGKIGLGAVFSILFSGPDFSNLDSPNFDVRF